MIYANNSSISTAINYIYNNLSANQLMFIDRNPLITDNDALRYVRIKNSSFLTMHDYYYDLKYRKSHPAKGLVVTIAGLDYADKDSDINYLLNNAVLDARSMDDENSRYLVAEINVLDTYKRDLFIEHNFKLSFDRNDTSYYICDTRS